MHVAHKALAFLSNRMRADLVLQGILSLARQRRLLGRGAPGELQFAADCARVGSQQERQA